MEELIKDKLSQIEKEYSIRILYACESGSRAWGFPSPNSDFDVRFIYTHNLDWHLSLREKKDTIEIPINDELDIGGWEIKKVLSLLLKSNAPLFEWIQSPIVYWQEEKFLEEILELSRSYFSPIAVMHHYLSMSKKYLDECNGDKVKLKKYFYALRTTISGAWIRDQGTMPHIEMPKMFSIIDDVTRDKIKELIMIKAGQSESYLHPQESILSAYIETTIGKNEKIANDLPVSRGDFERLDNFYRRVVKGEI